MTPSLTPLANCINIYVLKREWPERMNLEEEKNQEKFLYFKKFPFKKNLKISLRMLAFLNIPKNFVFFSPKRLTQTRGLPPTPPPLADITAKNVFFCKGSPREHRDHQPHACLMSIVNCEIDLTIPYVQTSISSFKLIKNLKTRGPGPGLIISDCGFCTSYLLIAPDVNVSDNMFTGSYFSDILLTFCYGRLLRKGWRLPTLLLWPPLEGGLETPHSTTMAAS